MSIRFAAALLFTAGLSLSTGCEQSSSPPAPKPAPTTTSTTTPAPSTTPSTAPSTAPAPGSTTPLSPHGGPVAPAPAAVGGEITAGGVAFKVPAGWTQVTPSSTMRLAELHVPDPSGNAAKDCIIAVSSAGGDVESNISRWAGQIKDAAGAPAKAAKQDKQVGGLTVHTVEFEGAYQGMSDPAPNANWMLRGAIVETAPQMLFIKMTGPAESMKSAAPGWNALIDSLRKP